MAQITNTAVVNTGDWHRLPNVVHTIYSKEIYFQALPVMRFAQFAVNKEELGKESGDTIQFIRYDNLEEGGKIEENENMPEVPMNDQAIQITVDEYGNATKMSNRLLVTAFTNTMQDASILLGRDYAIVTDKHLRDTYLGTPNVVYAGNAVDRASIASGDTFDTTVIADTVEILKTNNAMKVGGQFYICFVSPHQARTLRDDDKWIKANNYANTRALFLGEIGMWDDVVFIETTQMPILVGSGSLNANVYQSVMFGENAVGLGVALPVEMRTNGIEDYGRRRGLGWYSIFGSGIITEENIVRIETA